MKRIKKSLWKRSFNLRTKFLVGFVTIITLITVLIAVAAGYRFVNDIEHSIEQNGRTLSGILARAGLIQAVFLDDQDLRSLVDSFVNDDDEVIYAQVVIDGIEEANKSIVDIELGWNFISSGPHVDRDIYFLRNKLEDGTPYIDIIHVINLGQSFISATDEDRNTPERTFTSFARLGISLGRIQGEIQQTILGVVFISLGAMMVGSILIFIYYQKTWKPLELINNAVRKFGLGETHVRARVHTQDELETLADSFNNMADAIVKKDEQMYQVNFEMQRANRAKSDFLAAMSHDLKTPLHVISGYTQLMLAGDGGQPSEIHQAHLESMLRSSDRLLEFIERILSFSKIESGEEPLNVESLSASQLTKEAVEPLQSLAKRKELQLDLSIETDVMFYADQAKMKQVLSNLVENAIKYTTEGTVSVRVFHEGNGVYWNIQDSGPGIPEQLQAFIFEPFGRLEDAQIKITDGIGLGLAIVKRYVEAHGGSVTVESLSGKGSTFIVCIPLEVELDEDSDR